MDVFAAIASNSGDIVVFINIFTIRSPSPDVVAYWYPYSKKGCKNNAAVSLINSVVYFKYSTNGSEE